MKLLRALILLAGIAVMPVGYAEMRSDEQNPADISPAAGPEEPTLLDVRVEEIKDSAKGGDEAGAAAGLDEQEKNAAKNAERERKDGKGGSDGKSVAASGLKVLSNGDAAAYRDAFRRARRGEAPNLKAGDKVLAGEVQGLYLLNSKSGFADLNGWLKEHRDLPMAAEVYDMAQDKRARPQQKCRTETVTKKVDGKGKNKDGSKKTATKKVKKRVCATVGEWGPMPVVPLAVEKREERQRQREMAREGELNKLSPEGRKTAGQSWRLRGQGKYADAMAVMLAPGSRVEVGSDIWQSELVKVADYYHGQRDWKMLLKAAEPASSVRGPQRDDAHWLAGYGHYMTGNKAKAVEHWDALVQGEPVGGPHFARAAWWGARASREAGDGGKAKELLQAGAKDSISFYGQLCAAKLGRTQALDWSMPRVNEADFGQLQRVPAARRGLALAQVGEVAMAQRQLRAANEDLPYNATRALAASALHMGLPATALYAGKQLREQGEVVPAALFPLAEDWKPGSGWQYDRALMLGIMRQESAFNPQIGSRVGAQGLMQIMPATGKYIARLTGQPLPDRADLHDPATNLNLAQAYLKYLSGKLDGNQMLVVAAYNGGIGNVQRWLSRGVTPGHDPVLWLESIPFDETRDYVEKVFANYWLYQQRMKQTPWSLQALASGYWPLQWGGKVASR